MFLNSTRNASNKAISDDEHRIANTELKVLRLEQEIENKDNEIQKL